MKKILEATINYLKLLMMPVVLGLMVLLLLAASVKKIIEKAIE